MIGIKLNNEFLDLKPDTKLRLVLVSPLFSDTIGHNSHTFNFTIPNTPKNRRILDHADLVLKTNQSCTYDDARLYLKGIPFRPGYLKIKTIIPGQDINATMGLDLSAVSQRLSAKKMTEFLYDGPRVISATHDKAVIQAHMLATTAGTMATFDYVFFPVHNPSHYEDDVLTFYWPSGGYFPWVNYWYTGRFWDTFDASTIAGVTAPFPHTLFPYLMYILDQVAIESGYTLFPTSFMTDAELKTLVIYNAYFIDRIDNYPGSADKGTFELNQHVPDVTAAEFLQGIRKMFGLAIIANDDTIKLVPYNDIIADTSQIDWTEKGLVNYSIDCEDWEGCTLSSEQDGDDNLTGSDFVADHRPPIVGTVADFASLPAATGSADVYYVTNENAYYRDDAPWAFISFDVFPVKLDDGKDEKKSIVSTTQHHVYDGAVVFNEINGRVPRVDQLGISDFFALTNDPAFSPRLLFYRGMETDDATFGPYPQATADDHAGAHNYSLYWHGDKGLYETWWRGWVEMLQDAKAFTYLLDLSFADVLTLDWEKKHRVRVNEGEAVCYIQQIEMEITMSGIEPVKADLLRINPSDG